MPRTRTEEADGGTSLVARVALIMGAFDRAGPLLRLDQIVSRTGLPRSSVHRILTQLQKSGMLQHLPNGYSVAAAGKASQPSSDYSLIRGAAAPALERLQADTDLVVQLGVLSGAEVIHLDKLTGASGIAVPTRVAGRTPAHASALGKAVLAQLPAEQVDALYGKALRKCTLATISDLPTLHHELARIRNRNGLAFDHQELAIELSSIAAPIRHPGPDVVALSLTAPAPAPRLERMAPFITRAARSIGNRLGAAAGRVAEPVPDTPTDNMLSRVLRTLSTDAWV